MPQNLKADQELAKKNLSRVPAQIPKRLVEREERISSQLSKSKNSPGRKLEKLYFFMDELYGYVLPLTPCKNGCSLCCYYPVSICEIEISHIEKYAKKKRLRQTGPLVNFHGTACPFLEEGECSIYLARPFVCRRHTAFTETNYWCDPRRSNENELPLLKFTGVEEAFDSIRKESKSFDSFDIRQIFTC